MPPSGQPVRQGRNPSAGEQRRRKNENNNNNNNNNNNMSEPVYIVGGGIVGAASAYFLAQRGVQSVIIERSSIGAAASGKAGGFLGRGWGDGSCTAALHRQGFDLHVQLASALDVSSFRRLPTRSASVARNPRKQRDEAASWLDGSSATTRPMDEDTAQVTPLELTTKLVEASRCEVVDAVVTDAKVDKESGLISLAVEDNAEDAVTLQRERVIEAKQVVFTMGPWSVALRKWLGLNVPMTGIRSTSVIISPPPDQEGNGKFETDAVALFCNEDRNGCHLEVFPRPDNRVYLCGCGGSEHIMGEDILALKPTEVFADEARVAKACESFRGMTKGWVHEQAHPDRVTSQACMRPLLDDGLPMIGQLKDQGDAKVFVACGHNCWGILWGPITGQIIADLVVEGACERMDLSHFDPHRF